MKNFQIFLKGGEVRYAAADKIEVGKSHVVLYSGERIVASYDKPSVIMLDEFEIKGTVGGGDCLKKGLPPLKPAASGGKSRRPSSKAPHEAA